MSTRTYTTTADEHGAIHLPEGSARPGSRVTVVVQQSVALAVADHPSQTEPEDLPLTILTADTPEKVERFRQQVRAWGDRNRASATKRVEAAQFDDWLYGEDGLPR